MQIKKLFIALGIVLPQHKQGQNKQNKKYKEEIDTISQKLNSERLTAIERKCLRSNILQYSLEIPYYHWNSYEKAMKKGYVHQYQSINLSPGEKIKVMQCRYDEMGYYKIEFVDDVD